MYWYQTKDDLGMFSKLGESKHEAIGMAGAGNMTWTKLEVDISDCHLYHAEFINLLCGRVRDAIITSLLCQDVSLTQ